MTRVLVTGATGNVGSELLPALAAREVEVRALIHSPKASAAVDAPGIEAVQGDFENQESIRKALAGVERLFLLTPTDQAQADWEANLIALAVEAGVSRIVKLSVINADPASPVAIYASHGHGEQALREAGVPHSIIRCNEFMQNLLLQAPSIAAEATIYGTGVGGKAVAMVDVRDVAAVASELLTADDIDQEFITVTGPAPVTFATAASEIGKALGKSVAYSELAPSEFRSALIDDGTPPWVADALVGLYVSYGEGAAGMVTSAVRDVVGGHGRSLRQFAADYAEALGGR